MGKDAVVSLRRLQIRADGTIGGYWGARVEGRKKVYMCVEVDVDGGISGRAYEDPVEVEKKSDTTSTSDSGNDELMKKPYLIGILPTELQLVIFDYLDPVSSACLGITRKKFYGMHRERHGTVDLDSEGARGGGLWYLLLKWADQGGLVPLKWSFRIRKFVSDVRYHELEVECNQQQLL